ncbi:MAG: hypothetical protein AAGU11_00920 [Syntrophobacteraceae bacterium]
MIDRVIFKHPFRDEVSFLRDRQSRTEFTDIIGAWSWPEREPGHLMIFGLVREIEVKRKERRVILCMQEWTVPGMAEIVGLLAPAAKFFKVQEWIADTYNDAAMESFSAHMDRLSPIVKSAPGFNNLWPSEAPFARDIKKRYFQYAHAIRDQLPDQDSNKDDGKLYFGGCDMARAAVKHMTGDKGTMIEDFPVVACLGFGVTHIRMHRGGIDEA